MKRLYKRLKKIHLENAKTSPDLYPLWLGVITIFSLVMPVVLAVLSSEYAPSSSGDLFTDSLATTIKVPSLIGLAVVLVFTVINLTAYKNRSVN